ncbi:accessory factor associated with RNA polymerase II [Ascosphaera pollenicola]|nr:accessory factor associated with RNA polymerase II [Ascosphaera pollenicola]
MPKKRKTTAAGVPARANTAAAASPTASTISQHGRQKSKHAHLSHGCNTSSHAESPTEFSENIPEMEVVIYPPKKSRRHCAKDEERDTSSDRMGLSFTPKLTAQPRGDLHRPSTATKSYGRHPGKSVDADEPSLTRATVQERPNVATTATEEFKFGDVNLYELSPSKTTPRRKRLVDRLNLSPTVPTHAHRLSFSSESPPPTPTKRGSPKPFIPHMEPGQVSKNAPITGSQDILSMGPRITYSRNRSYLDDEADIFGHQHGSRNPASSPSLSTARSNSPKKPKFSLLGNPYSLHSNTDEDVVTGSGSVRNIHELRRAGETARFESLVDSIFEDIHDGVSSQRSGLVQLVSKLQDEEFSRRFLTHAMEKRLTRVKPDQSDLICSFLIASAYGLLLSIGTISSSAFKICSSSLLDIVTPLLKEKNDILAISKSPQLKISKAFRSSLIEILVSMRESRIWVDEFPKKLTPELLGLRCIELIMRRDRKAGESKETLPDSVLEQLIDIIVQIASEAQTTVPDVHVSHVLELTFSILESYTVALQDMSSTQGRLMYRLACLGSLLNRLANGGDMSSRNRQIRIICIRLVLNLTNNEPDVCEKFSTPEIINSLSRIVATDFPKISGEASVDDIDAVIDTVILALGCCINLAEWSETSRKLAAETKRGSRSFLDILILFFRNGRESASEESIQADNVEKTRFNVVLGYLSVFLCTLCLDESVRRHLNTAFQGKGVNQLLATVEEFLKYYRKVEEDIRDANGHQDPMTIFIARLQGIVDRVRDSGNDH